MAEAVLLCDLAVENKRGRLIMRLVASGDDVEILRSADRSGAAGFFTLRISTT